MQSPLPVFRVLWFAFFNTQIVFGALVLLMAVQAASDTPTSAIAPLVEALSFVAGLTWVAAWFVPRWAPRFFARLPPEGDPHPLKKAYVPFILRIVLFEVSGIVGVVIGMLQSKEMGIGFVVAALVGIALSYPTEDRLRKLAGLT